MKQLIRDYTFDASAKTITFTNINPVSLAGVLLITNVTDQVVIYQFNSPTKGGTVATNVLTLEYDTTSMDDTDKLQILYDDALYVTDIITTGTQPTLVGGSYGGEVRMLELSDEGYVLAYPATTFPVSDAGGSITVDGAVTVSGTATVSGTVAATQSGTWTVQPGNTANTTAWKVDGSAVTQPVSLASVPSHAVTNAGTFAVQVDGSALTSLQLIDDPVATTASAIPSKGMAVSGTDGTNARVLKTDTSGELQVDVLTLPTVTVNSHAVTNAGTFAVQVDGNALTSLQLIDDTVIADDAAFTPATSKVMMAGFQSDETATDSVDEGDAGAARMTLDRKVIVTPQPHTQGGLSVKACTSSDGATALTNSAQAIKASAGQLYGWYIGNPNTSGIYVHLYDVAAASVTVGTTNPLFSLWIPASGAANLIGDHGIAFGTALSASATTTGGGNTAPSTAMEATFFYK